ncbi:MAG: hypothetical protein GXO78_05775 [Calditrichaeota bacterium]|nr:hypothetical protein [Calditrichota bacterium]
MRRTIWIIFICLGWIISLAQNVRVEWLKQLEIPPKKNCRVPIFSPDGKYLSFEIHDNENAYLYLYDIATDRFVQLGKTEEAAQTGMFGTLTRRGTEFTGHITWWYDREEESLVFDFVHTPTFGRRVLYQGWIDEGESIEKFRNREFDTDVYEKYDRMRGITIVRYPGLSHKSVNGIPWVVFADKQSLYLFNHGRYDLPVKITSPTGLWADLMAQFSPDDRRLVFIRDSRENTDIGLITLRATSAGLSKINEELIISGKAIEVSPAWSPNGRWIAYFSDKGHSRNFSIWIYELETGKTYPVVDNVEVTEDRRQTPTWVGNYGLIFVRRDIKKGYPIMYYDLQTRREILVRTGTVNNLSTTVHQLSGREFLLAFTARGQENTEQEEYIWTKLYLAKLIID